MDAPDQKGPDEAPTAAARRLGIPLVETTARMRHTAATASRAQPTRSGLISLSRVSSVIVAPVVPHEIEASPMRRRPISIAVGVYGKGFGHIALRANGKGSGHIALGVYEKGSGHIALRANGEGFGHIALGVYGKGSGQACPRP